MEIIHRSKVESIQDVCWEILELYNSNNLSVSIAKITWKSDSHKHEIMEEVYFVLSGEWIIYIDHESEKIEKWDLISIPKNKFHHIETKNNSTIEILVITNPKFNKQDVIT